MSSFVTRFCSAVAVTAVLLASLCVPVAQANYSIDPLRVEINFKGKRRVATSSVKVTNLEETPIRLRAYVEDWNLDELGGLTLVGTDDTWGVSKRVRFNPKEFELQPEQVQVVRLAVSLPPTAPDGEYRGMLFFENLKSAQQRMALSNGYGATVEIKQRYGIAVYAFKNADNSNPTITTASVAPENNKTVLELTLQNDGKRHTRMLGTVVISKKEGGQLQPISEVKLQDLKDIVVLPGQARKLSVPLNQSPTNSMETVDWAPGDYVATISLKLKNNQGDILEQVVPFSLSASPLAKATIEAADPTAALAQEELVAPPVVDGAAVDNAEETLATDNPATETSATE